MQKIPKFQFKEWARLIILAGAVAFTVMNVKEFIVIFQKMMGIISPLLIGFFAAFVLNLPMEWLEAKISNNFKNTFLEKHKRPVAVIISLLLVLGITGLVIILVIPQLISTLGVITEKLPGLYTSLWKYIEDMGTKIPALRAAFESANPANTETLNRLIDGAGGMANLLLKGAGGFFGSVINLVVGIVFGIYILLSKENLMRQGNRLMSAYVAPQKISKINYIFSVTSSTFSKFISGQVVEAMVIGVITAVTMMILQFPYATMIGTVIGFLSLIPIVGAISGGALGFIIILSVSPTKAILFLVYIVILQQIDGNFIYPRIVGDSVGLPALWVLVAITLGGGIYGILGTLLGVPTFATIYKLLRNDVASRLDGNPNLLADDYSIEPDKPRTKVDMVRTLGPRDDSEE